MNEIKIILYLLVLLLAGLLGSIVVDIKERIEYVYWAKKTYKLTKGGYDLIEYKREDR